MLAHSRPGTNRSRRSSLPVVVEYATKEKTSYPTYDSWVRDNSQLLIGREVSYSQPSTPRRRMSAKVSTIAFEGELNSIVSEYLEHGDYTQTQEVFERECNDRAKPISQGNNKSVSNQKLLAVQNEMIKLFQFGNGAEYFMLWDKNLPANIKNDDPVAQKLEFYLNIYFATFPMRQGSDKDDSEEAMSKFKHYIETRGAALSQTTEFLPFYALPFVPNPRAHPTYRELFSDTWVSDLQARVEKFLTLAMASTPQPRLFELYNTGGGGKDLQGQISLLQQQIVDAEKRTMTYMKRHNKVQADYHNLIGITAELVDALESTVQGNPVSPEYLQQICGRLFQSQTRFASQSLDLTRPGTAAEVLRASIAPKNDVDSVPPPSPPPQQTTPDILSIYDMGDDGESFTDESEIDELRTSVNSQGPSLPPLDYEKIKNDLQNGSERSKVLLLQALRWRLTRSSPGDQRDSVISAYINNDLLGCAQPGPYRTAILELLTSQSEVVRQYIARLFNAFASLCPGRTYLSLNSDLLRGLMENLRGEDKDSVTRENVLGALQKLSLRRNLQSAMIGEGIIDWLVEVLEDNDSLSDYTLEYSVALLMNLCLRTAGKKKCTNNTHKTLKVLSDLLGHENAEILPYVNGTLYSILAIHSIREEAKAMGMEEILKCFIKEGQPDMNRQIEFIIKQLNSTEEADDAESDDEEEEEDEEDQDAMEADLDKAEIVKPVSGETTGEELLRTEYPGVPQSSHKKRRDHLLANEPLTRPVTPGQRKASELSLVPSRSQSRNAQQSRPQSQGVERPPTRSGSRPGTAESNKSGSSGEKKFSGGGTPRPSHKALENLGSNADLQEYGKAFSSRPKIPRTPDVTGGRPTSRGSVADAAPQPTYSDTLPRSRPGSGSSRNGHTQNSNSPTNKKSSSSSGRATRVKTPNKTPR